MQTWILQDLVKRLEWAQALAYVSRHHLVVPCKKILGTSRGSCGAKGQVQARRIGVILLATTPFAMRSHTWDGLGGKHH